MNSTRKFFFTGNEQLNSILFTFNKYYTTSQYIRLGNTTVL